METLDGVKKVRKPSMKGPAKERRRRVLKRLEPQLKELLTKQNKTLGELKSKESAYFEAKAKSLPTQSDLHEDVDYLKKTLAYYTQELVRVEKEVSILKTRI